jgi:transcriptional regulator with XRE-family HTH domain
MGRTRLTMTQAVGRRIRRERSERNWSQERFVAELLKHGMEWSRSTLAQAELGKRSLSVDELYVLGLTLGIAPHLLLYPPPGTDIAIGQLTPGPELAEWLWDPDQHRLTRPGETERRRWFESVGLADQLSDEQVEELRATLRGGGSQETVIEQDREEPQAKKLGKAEETSSESRRPKWPQGTDNEVQQGSPKEMGGGR